MISQSVSNLTRSYPFLASFLCVLYAPAQTLVYLESDHRVVFEVEDHALVSPWTIETGVSGYTGTGFIRGGEDHFQNPGVGVLSFRIQVANSGRYQLNWRNRIGLGSDKTEHNDSWARMTDLNGNPKAPVGPTDPDDGLWHKVYVTVANQWDYGSSNDDVNQVALAWDLVAGETYHFEISTRSKDHLLDRVVLWDQNTYDYANETSGKELGSTLSVLDALAPSSTTIVIDPPDPEKINVLFIRAASGTTVLFGGAECDITDFSTSGGNSGWGSLANLLDANGFNTSQLIEGPSSAPIDLHTLDLTQYGVIVFGSNNADYAPSGDESRIDAIEDFVRQGGGILFISDATFGSTWSDASDSDQQFLDRFGIIANQDNDTYTSARADGDYLVSDHPILDGINEFDGQGVTAFSIGTAVPGVATSIIVRAEEDVRRNDNSAGGTVEPATANDGALVIALAGGGRVACHYDPNSFFNANGAGTDINEYDNSAYALNLFEWLAGGTSADESADSKEIFQLENFNEEDRDNAAISGDLANVDGDPFINAVEYILGLDPWSPDYIEPLALEPSGSDFLIQFTVRQDLATGYGLELFQAVDLTTLDPWTQIDLVTITQEEGEPGFWDYSLTADPDILGDNAFWKLNFLIP